MKSKNLFAQSQRSYGQTHAVGEKIGEIIRQTAETVTNITFFQQQMRLPWPNQSSEEKSSELCHFNGKPEFATVTADNEMLSQTLSNVLKRQNRGTNRGTRGTNRGTECAISGL